MKIIITIHISNKVPARWASKLTFVSVSQFWGLALCCPSGSISGPFVTTPCPVVSLGGRKKKGKKREREEKNKPSGDFKPIQQVLLVFLDATGIRGLSFSFFPSYVFERIRTRSGL